MKLAIFSPNVLPVPAIKGGAVEELTTYIIEENEKLHKYDIDLYTIDNDDNLTSLRYKYTNIISIKYFPSRVKEKIIKFLNKFLIRLPNGRIISDLSETLTQNYKKNYYDIVVVEDNRQVFNSLIRKINNEKVFFHIHDDVYPPKDNIKGVEKLVHPKDLNLIKGIIKSSDKIVTVSHYLENRFKKYGARNTVTLYNGILKSNLKTISLEEQKEIKKRFGIKDGDVVFTFIGRFISDKGIDKLLLSMELLKMYSNLKLVIVGKKWLPTKQDDEYSIRLKNIINSFPKSVIKRIIFTGYVEHSQINQIYSISDCLVVPSQYEEAFGVVALEAMTMGVPIIVSDSGGLPEVVGDSAIIVQRGPNFVRDLAKAMKKIYLNPTLRMQLGQKGKKRSTKFPNTKEEYFKNFIKIVN